MARCTLYIVALVLCMFTQIYAQAEPQIPQAVINFSAAKDERYHHSFFHNARMLYLWIDPQERRELAKLGWAPPRPAKAYTTAPAEIILNGDAGEDFLYMHRKMIDQVNAISAAAGSSWRVKGWTACPAPGDKTYPTPVYTIPGEAILTKVISDTKTDDFYWDVIKPTEEWLENPENLRTLTLGELGVKLEFGIHTWFHLRFSAANPVGYRNQAVHPTVKVDEKWNDVRYNWLADFYSAHVNPTFWKIHGWIENKIEAWRVANGIKTIVWKGTWESGPMSVLEDLFKVGADGLARDAAAAGGDTDSSSSDDADINVDPAALEQIVNLLLQNAGGN